MPMWPRWYAPEFKWRGALISSNPWIVLKFGGTSVARAAHWPTIRDAIDACHAEGARPVVVCSALSGISNLLEKLLAAADAGDESQALLDDFRECHEAFAAELEVDADSEVESECRRVHGLLAGSCRPVPPEVRAEIMAAGELLSTRIGAKWLSDQGLLVEWHDARDLLCSRRPAEAASDYQRYLAATCCYERDDRLVAALEPMPASGVVLTQGFIARNDEGRTVLLGRGGSDTAAAYFAAKLGARRLEIWTDVPGVFTANPRKVPQARLLKTLSYEEAEMLAGMGGKVLHPRCLQPVHDAGIPLQIRWTERPEVEGTVISEISGGPDNGIKAVSARQGLCLISAHKRAGWQPVGFIADVASCFKRQGLSIDLISSSASSIQTTVDPAVSSGLVHEIPELLEQLQSVCTPNAEFGVESISLVGHGIRDCLHQLGPVLELLTKAEVLMWTQSANDLMVSFVVPKGQSQQLLNDLHARLFEERLLDAPFGASWSELQMENAESADDGSLEPAAMAG